MSAQQQQQQQQQQQHADRQDAATPPTAFRAMLLGYSGAGKSTFVNALSGASSSAEPHFCEVSSQEQQQQGQPCTRAAQRVLVDKAGLQLEVLDTTAVCGDADDGPSRSAAWKKGVEEFRPNLIIMMLRLDAPGSDGKDTREQYRVMYEMVRRVPAGALLLVGSSRERFASDDDARFTAALQARNDELHDIAAAAAAPALYTFWLPNANVAYHGQFARSFMAQTVHRVRCAARQQLLPRHVSGVRDFWDVVLCYKEKELNAMKRAAAVKDANEELAAANGAMAEVEAAEALLSSMATAAAAQAFAPGLGGVSATALFWLFLWSQGHRRAYYVAKERCRAAAAACAALAGDYEREVHAHLTELAQTAKQQLAFWMKQVL